MKKLRIIVITIITTLIVLFVVGYFVLRHVPASTYALQEKDTTSHWGTITGSLSYPSDFIPALGVCAQTADKLEEYCTYERVEDDAYTYGVGYELLVPPGQYYVFSHEVSDVNALTGYQPGDYLAYYSDYVTCTTDRCASHQPIIVTVAGQETVRTVDPGDWYNF